MASGYDLSGFAKSKLHTRRRGRNQAPRDCIAPMSAICFVFALGLLTPSPLVPSRSSTTNSLRSPAPILRADDGRSVGAIMLRSPSREETVLGEERAGCADGGGADIGRGGSDGAGRWLAARCVEAAAWLAGVPGAVAS